MREVLSEKRSFGLLLKNKVSSRQKGSVKYIKPDCKAPHYLTSEKCCAILHKS